MNIICELMKTPTFDPEQHKLFLLEYGGAEEAVATDGPRITYTHLVPYRLARALANENCRIVFLLRNPKDAAVSFYYHLRKAAVISNKQTWGEFFESPLKGSNPYGPYAEYIEEWEKVFKDGPKPNVDIFYYEDMKRDPVGNVRRLNDFLGTGKTEDELTAVVEACSIDKLREKANRAEIPLAMQTDEGEHVIYRKGDVGDWKNHFTVSQNERLDKTYQARIAKSIFKTTYEL